MKTHVYSFKNQNVLIYENEKLPDKKLKLRLFCPGLEVGDKLESEFAQVPDCKCVEIISCRDHKGDTPIKKDALFEAIFLPIKK